MAHNLNITNGKVSFASGNGRTPWHGLGQIVEGAMTSQQAVELGGLDYQVAKVPVMGNKEGVMLPIADKFATFRTDTDQVLGIVGKKYQIVQNSEAFSFFDSIVGNQEAVFETAGALGQGERIFISAKMPNYIRIEGTDDVTETYVVLTNSHDGSGSIVACISPVRVVCANTLNASLKHTKNKVSIRHTSSAKANLATAHKLLGISNLYVSEMNECFNHLSKKRITDSQVKILIENLFVSEKVDSTRIMNIREAVTTAYFTGIGKANIIGTAWGFLNGVTYYLDHVKTYKNASSKFENILEGNSAKITQQTLTSLMAM